MKATEPEIESKLNFYLFDNYEIEYMELIRDINGGHHWTRSTEVTCPGEKIIGRAWTVFGHYNPELCDGFGGVEALADCPTKAIAEQIKAALQAFTIIDNHV